MTIHVDIDDTLIKSEKHFCGSCGRMKYFNAQPIQKEIDLVNDAFNNHTIILYTGRQEDARNITEQQLKKFGVRYHQLKMGKDFEVYIDATMAFKSIGEIL